MHHVANRGLTIIDLPPNTITLDCSNNKLTQLPEMPVLRTLICIRNKLTSLPVLTNLTALYCEYNNLTSLPVLPNLEILFCQGNRLTMIPLLSKLRDLWCSNNMLTSLPLLKCLDWLLCQHNRFNDTAIIIQHLPFPTLAELAVSSLQVKVDEVTHPTLAGLQRQVAECHGCGATRLLYYIIYPHKTYSVPVSAMLCRGCYTPYQQKN